MLKNPLAKGRHEGARMPVACSCIEIFSQVDCQPSCVQEAGEEYDAFEILPQGRQKALCMLQSRFAAFVPMPDSRRVRSYQIGKMRRKYCPVARPEAPMC